MMARSRGIRFPVQPLATMARGSAEACPKNGENKIADGAHCSPTSERKQCCYRVKIPSHAVVEGIL